MLDAIKKKLGITPTKEEAKMENEKQEADLSAVDKAAMEALQASFASQAEELKAALSKLSAMEALLEATKAAQAEMVAKAKEVKMAARRAVVEANIGTAKADAFLAATEGLDDAAFAAVSSALVGSLDVEAKSAHFVEAGVEAKADPAKLASDAESEEMKLLKQKYAK